MARSDDLKKVIKKQQREIARLLKELGRTVLEDKDPYEDEIKEIKKKTSKTKEVETNGPPCPFCGKSTGKLLEFGSRKYTQCPSCGKRKLYKDATDS
jgi:uncharacterized protein with PIN domain